MGRKRPMSVRKMSPSSKRATSEVAEIRSTLSTQLKEMSREITLINKEGRGPLTQN